MTILDLLQADGINPKPAGSTHGGEYASKCPWCGGKDRFRIWPYQGEGGNYWCRQCRKSGGTIRYLMEYRGMSYKDACTLLGRVPASTGVTKSRDWADTYGHTHVWQPGPPQEPPPAKWQAQAEKLITWAENCLWRKDYINVRNSFMNRGLNESAIKEARLGWLPQDFYPDREAWGLPSAIKDNGERAKLKIPAGLIIPLISL